MSRPRIALIGRFAEHTSATRYAAIVSARALVESVWRAGADPVTLLAAPAPDGMDWAARLAGFDGVLLCGGGDIDPQRYGHAYRHPDVYDVDWLQDESDLSLAAYALESGIPTLAVCRGLHVVNVARGGSLEQHMDIGHRHMVHTVDVESAAPGIPTGPFKASCYHHQRIDRLGKGLRVVGRADDNTVEAVEIDSPGWAFGVQWHPEDTADADPVQQAVFDAFVAASR